MQLIDRMPVQTPAESDGARAEIEFTLFALEAGLIEVVPPSEGVYPFTMKTTYSSGSEATDN